MSFGGNASAIKAPIENPHQRNLLPGAKVCGRYRIVALLGKGGMGEVYQADDLKLGQTVALKFLPPEFAQEPRRLEFFLNEARLARQVSHPNVCRVHDIGEFEGLHFLSMEFIDGEDLSSLLRRIGRLPSEKGVEIAVQLCAALGAAHAKGVIHRDLKPANVMIDGRGRVRITDFGLALDSDTASIRGATVGTPAYMAPEHLLSGETSEQSDLYALGLILYELFTGKPPLEDRTLENLRKSYQEPSSIASPSSVVSELDPSVENVIMRCLQHDPSDRPQSAASVAAALPGGDPLTAALAAGETPSPALVAASGSRGGLHPVVGGLLCAVVLFQLLAVAWLRDHASLLGIVGQHIPTADVMENRAREVLAGLGHTQPPYDTASWFHYDDRPLERLRARDGEPNWQQLKETTPTPIHFLYRESPKLLVSRESTKLRVEPFDPPLDVPGMVMLNLDLRMQLRRLWVVPPVTDDDQSAQKEPDWEPLFEFAGIETDSLRRCDSTIVPSRFADTRMAWEGVLDKDEGHVTVEAAFLGGKPVSFRIIPTDRFAKVTSRPRPEANSLAPIVILLPLLVIVVVNLVLRNSRSGRVHWKGAMTLSLAVLVAASLASVLTAKSISHVISHPDHVVERLLAVLWMPLLVFALYAAIEPIVRRLWPQTLITWTRLLSGNFSDPLVGRDLLIGCVLGGTLAMTLLIVSWLMNDLSNRPSLETLMGSRQTLGKLIQGAVGALVGSLVYLLVLLLLRLIVRRSWLAMISFVALAILLGLVAAFNSNHPDVPQKIGFAVLIATLIATINVLAVTRIGLLATTAAMFCLGMLRIPISLDTSVWYWEQTSLLAILAITSLAAFGFVTSYRGWANAQT